ncbi:MAG: hypothetical protein QXV82_09200 [Ignisphaera sp.]
MTEKPNLKRLLELHKKIGEETTKTIDEILREKRKIEEALKESLRKKVK